MAKNEIIKNRPQNIKLLEEQTAIMRVLSWFFAYPSRSLSLSELAKNIEISKTSANKIVNSLVNEGFLRKEVLGKIWRISCNQNHLFNTTIKIPYHLSLIYNSGIIPEVLKHVPNPRAIILFGSYRKGDDYEKSDVDIAVEILDKEELKIINLGILSELGYRKNVPVNLHIFSRKKIDLNLFSNIANGIIIQGFLEVKI